MDVTLLAIGDELVLGQTVDTNSAWLSAQLARRGLGTRAHHTVSDVREDIAEAIRAAAEQSPAVLITGGLGPTDDDLTRDALADVMGVGLQTDEAALSQVRAFFEGRGRVMAERNAVQAMRPAGAAMIPNAHGTAPGLRAVLGQSTVYVMPGVPDEMRKMFDASVLPELLAVGGPEASRVILTTKLNTFGRGESDLAEMLGDLGDRGRNPIVGTTVSAGLVSVRVRAEFGDETTAHTELEATIERVRERLGPIIFGRDDQTLQQDVVSRLSAKGLTVATAESCTGGMIGGMLTDVPGSSDVYTGGWVTYSNTMKASQLGVSEAVLTEHGAVSEATVRAMARGALERAGTDYAVATSGVAGPGGGTTDKPVGMVWIGLACRAGRDEVETLARCVRLPGGRSTVRDRGAKCALQLLRLHVMGEDLSHLHWAEALPEASPSAAR